MHVDLNSDIIHFEVAVVAITLSATLRRRKHILSFAVFATRRARRSAPFGAFIEFVSRLKNDATVR